MQLRDRHNALARCYSAQQQREPEEEYERVRWWYFQQIGTVQWNVGPFLLMPSALAIKLECYFYDSLQKDYQADRSRLCQGRHGYMHTVETIYHRRC